MKNIKDDDNKLDKVIASIIHIIVYALILLIISTLFNTLEFNKEYFGIYYIIASLIIFILDEPTTGLHTDDVKKLISILQRIVDNGDSVIIIEHNLDMIKVADYIIDLGPDGGDFGGEIIAKGTPEQVSKCEKSYTGYYLKEELKK